MPVSTKVRMAWLVPGTVLTIAMLGWGTHSVVSALAFDRKEFQMTFTQPVRSIDVEGDTGSVRIVGTDRDEVAVEGEIVRGLTTPKHREQVVDGRLEIESSCPGIATFCSVDYVIHVPRNLSITARASGGGIRVVDMDGDLDLSSSGGDVRATGLRSAVVEASSSGGSVRLSFVDPPRTVDASSSGGGVTVEVPETSVGYAVDASSSGGDVDVDVTRNDNSQWVIRAHSSGGGVTVRYPELL